MSWDFGHRLDQLRNVLGSDDEWVDPGTEIVDAGNNRASNDKLGPSNVGKNSASPPNVADARVSGVRGAPQLDDDSDLSDGPNVAKAFVSKASKGRQVPRPGYRHLRAPGGPLHVNAARVEEVKKRQDVTSFNLKKGQSSQEGEEFTPWNLVERYPLGYIGNTNRPSASKFFTRDSLTNNQIWDVFYIYDPATSKALLLVPKSQFQHLLEYVNAALGISLRIPDGQAGETFGVSFGVGGTPLPRYLGRSNNPEEFTVLSQTIPKANDQDDLKAATTLAAADFCAVLKNIQRTGGAKGNPKKKKKKEADRIALRKLWGKSAKRVQQYLGLRESAEFRTGTSAEPSRAATAPSDLNLSRLTLDPYDPNVDLVCVDVETFEFNHNLVTEVGIAVLNTAKMRGKSPGDGYQNWFAQIDAYHFIIDEHKWAKNGVHVDGHQQNFNFGKSQVVKKADAASHIAKHLGDQVLGLEEGFRSRRPVVLVGHDVDQDVEHLKKLGFDCHRVPAISDVTDTTCLFRFWRRERDPRRLGAVLSTLGIQHRFLHNAGNDAVYTLQALLVLSHRMRQDSINRAFNPKPTVTERDPDEERGFTSSGEMSDGGAPVGLKSPSSDSK